MEKEIYKNILVDAFRASGYGDLINENAAEAFWKLSGLLIEANKTTNLTAITDEYEIIIKHFLDSATVCRYIHENAKIIDVGCGAGFPSLPIAILRPDVSVTSLDSTGKKIDFLNDSACKIGLKNIFGICKRAEDYAVEARETFDLCTGRAVSRLNVLSEICIPFVRVGGLFVAMKSSRGDEEYLEANKGIGILGCVKLTEEDIELDCKGDKLKRTIFVFNKIKKTPITYPRNYSQIKKKPL